MIRKLFILALSLCLAAPAMAEPLIQTVAKQAIVVDYDTGAILLEKNADEKMPTSSMSKVMSMYLVFEALKKGDITTDSKFHVSEKAWQMQGSKMFVDVGKDIKVEDLIRGVIVQSGNDATIVLAEGLAGSETAFAANITAKAKELGMTNSNFVNASGWPDPNHYSTARDLATLGVAIIRDFPQYYPYYSELEFTYNSIKQGNRNPLLYRKIGADGIKTGHTEAAGYGLIGSGTYNGRRVVIVLNGMADDKERAAESAKILEWGLQMFDNKKILTANAPVEKIKVALSPLAEIPAVVKEDLVITVPKAAPQAVKVTANFKEPLPAPITAGQEIGTLVVEIPNTPPIERKLYAGANAPKLGFLPLTIAKAKLFLGGGAS